MLMELTVSSVKINGSWPTRYFRQKLEGEREREREREREGERGRERERERGEYTCT